jgi:hypothetical protein
LASKHRVDLARKLVEGATVSREDAAQIIDVRLLRPWSLSSPG